MGCTSSKEKIEDQMMEIKLQRIEIQMDREDKINQLSKMEGRNITYQNIPDYIDPQFAVEKNIFYGKRIDTFEKISNEENKKNYKSKLKKGSKGMKKKKKK